MPPTFASLPPEVRAAMERSKPPLPEPYKDRNEYCKNRLPKVQDNRKDLLSKEQLLEAFAEMN